MAAIARAAAKEGVKKAKAAKLAQDRADGKVPNEDAEEISESQLAKSEFEAMRVSAHHYRMFGPLAPCLAHYRNFTLEIAIFLTRPEWEYMILATIIFAGVLVGVQTFDGMENDPIVNYCDVVILIIFSVEIILKLVAEGFRPWRYFVGPSWGWNNFDLIVVMLCMPIEGNPATSYAAILRLARLARLMKLVNKIPELKMIVLGMIGGLRAIFFICILLFLVFYLYCILGIILFERNDPWHFKDFATSMETLFRMATMEDWTDVMYINMYGCDEYHHGVYHLNHTRPIAAVSGFCHSGNDTTSQECGREFNAAAQENFTSPSISDDPTQCIGVADGDRQHELNCTWARGENLDMATSGCTHPEAQPFYSVFFCISFSVISGLVMLSMFVGAVSLSMTSSIDEINDKQTALRKKRQKKLNIAHLRACNDDDNAEHLPPEDFARKRRVEEALVAVWDGRNTSVLSRTKGSFTDPGLAKLSPLARSYLVLIANPIRAVTRSALFNNVILVVIIVACLLVGFQTDPNVKDNPTIKDPMHIIDRIATGAFALECVLKIIAEGITPWRYFLNLENLFDFFIVVGSFASGSGLFILLRLVRLFRVLKLVKSIPELRMHVTALIKGVQSIGYIGTIMMMFFYIFGIVAWIMFKQNDPVHFKHIGYAMLTLLRMATFEDWTDVMYINQYGCDRYGYNYDNLQVECEAPYAWGGWSVIFFMIFETLGSLVLLNLFIGVITASMEESADQLVKDKKMEAKINKIVVANGISQRQLRQHREVFDMVDIGNSGEITAEEFKDAFQYIGSIEITQPELELLFEQCAHAGDDDVDIIDEADFITFMHKGLDIKGGFSEEHLQLRATLPAAGTEVSGKGRKKEKGAKYVL